MKKIRLLKASEIECRVGQCGKSSKGSAWCSLLLYKDARCDQRILDEVFGLFGWKRKHEVINGQLCCTVSIKDVDGNEWVDKQDVGVESNTEAVKGSFSDSFKRACFNWGIGRELYTAPKIFIPLKADEVSESGGKVRLSPRVVFTVAEIGYDDERNINALTIVDGNGVVRYKLGQVAKEQKNDEDNDIDNLYDYAIPALEQATDREACQRVWNDYPQLQSEQRFIDAVNNRLSKLNAA